MFVENKTTEFKREYVEGIRNTIIAFANCDGGTLYIGINDDGTVYSVDNVDDIMLRVTNAVRDVVRPDVTMLVEFRKDVMDEKSIVCVTVQRGTARKRNSLGGCLCSPRSIDSSCNRCLHLAYDQGDQW